MIKLKDLLFETRIIDTNKGKFEVRYATKAENGKTYLIIGKNIKTNQYASEFDGDQGDEIEYSSSGLKKYAVKIPKGFSV